MITRPAADGRPVEGRFPAIWQHTLGIAGPGAEGGPLGADPALRGYRGAPSLARRGYVVVQVARPGHGPSFGRRRGYNDRTEAYDAYEIIDWLAAQPWSTGAVGVYGCSNTGDAALHAVTAGNRHVVIGPWTHCANGDFDMAGEMLRFFDAHLKGLDSGLAAQDPIHCFTINAPAGQAWRSSKTWPVAGTQPTPFYLDPRGTLAPTSPRAKAGGATFAVRYDLACPAEQKRTNALLTGANPCPQEHAGPHFVSAVLKTDTEVTGDAVADLWISANAADANVFAYLEDVAPDGTVTSITDARLKASLRKLNRPGFKTFDLPWHRAHVEDAKPLAPGEPAQLTFTFLPTSYVFKAGHRIRISVQGADYRERDRKPLEPAPDITVHGSAAFPSRVILPLITRGG